ncbi:MAG: TauD/TfdA dioxygenase family protein, partial [Alphaproteobacteria bacterium]
MTTTTAPTYTPLSSAIGVEVHDVDIRHLDDTTFNDIKRIWLEKGVLLFRGQNLEKDDQVAFSHRFGVLQPAPQNVKGDPWLADYPNIAVMSNIQENGEVIGSLGSGEAIWHSDMSY